MNVWSRAGLALSFSLFFGCSTVKNQPATQKLQERRVQSLGQEDPPGGGHGNPLQSGSLLGKSHGQRSLAGHSPWGCKESDTTEGTEHARQDELKSIPWGWKGCAFPDAQVVCLLPRPQTGTLSAGKKEGDCFGVSWRRCLLPVFRCGLFTFTLLI